jgi:hypothetical protein
MPEVELDPRPGVLVSRVVDDAVKERVMAHAGGVVSDPGVIAVLKLQRSV